MRAGKDSLKCGWNRDSRPAPRQSRGLSKRPPAEPGAAWEGRSANECTKFGVRGRVAVSALEFGSSLGEGR